VAKRGIQFKPTEADRLLVHRLAMAGRTQNIIADCLNITDDTLRKHFRYELTVAREELHGKAVQCLSDAIEDGSVDAAKYVLSRSAGWTEKQAIDHTTNGKDLAPTRIIIEAAAPKE